MVTSMKKEKSFLLQLMNSCFHVTSDNVSHFLHNGVYTNIHKSFIVFSEKVFIFNNLF